jgi:hypothetical protein
MPPILGKRGVTSLMRFPCCDCGDVTTGEDVMEGAYVHIVSPNRLNPREFLWRCECCQEDLEDRERE